MIFRRFPVTFRRFPKIFQNCSEGQTNVSGHFPNISEDFPKITEDCRRRPKKIRGCFDHTLTHSSAVEGTKEKCVKYDIFTCEDIISSHVRISYRFYQFVTTRYTTDFYIIKHVIVRLRVGPYREKLWPRAWKCCPRPAASDSIFKTSVTVFPYTDRP